MTVTTTLTKAIVLCNGAQVEFNYNFLIPQDGNYELVFTNAQGQNSVVGQAFYTVTGLGNPQGGTFIYPNNGGAPFPTGTQLTFARQDPLTSSTNFTNQNNYNPEVLQGAIDDVVLQVQQLAENISRCIQVPISENYQPLLPTPVNRANLALAFDAGGAIALINEAGGGGTLTLPANAPLLGSDGTGLPVVVTPGTGLSIEGGVLNAAALSLPANAIVLSTDATGTAQATTLGTGLSWDSGTLSATAAAVPASAPLLQSNAGGSITALALGAGLTSDGATLSAAGASIPASSFVLGADGSGNPVRVSIGYGLTIGSYGGTLSVQTPVNAPLLGTGTPHGNFVAVQLGAGLTTYTSSGTRYLASTINTPPLSAQFLGTDSGGTLTRGYVGAGLTLSAGGTLSANAASAPPNASFIYTDSLSVFQAGAFGSGLSFTGGTLTATAAAFPANAAVLASVSGTIVGLTLGSGLTSSSGTLQATGGAPTTPGVVSSNGTVLINTTLGAGLSYSSGTLSLATAPPAAGLVSSTGTSFVDTIIGSGLTYSAGTLSALGGSGTVSQIVTSGLITGGTITTTGTIGLAVPAAGIVSSNGSTALGTVTIGTGLTYTGGVLAASGLGSLTAGASIAITSGTTISVAALAAGLVSSNGTSLASTALAGGLSYGAGTLTGAAPWLITDGTHTITDPTSLTIASGGTISGSGNSATLTISGGGGGTFSGPAVGIGWAGPNVPALSGWTAVGGAMLSQPVGGPIVLQKAYTSSYTYGQAVYPVSGTSWTRTFLIEVYGAEAPGTGALTGFFASNAGGSLTALFGSNAGTLYQQRLASPTSVVTSVTSFNNQIASDLYWAQITLASNTLTYSLSKNGIHFYPQVTEALSSFLGTVTGVGVLANNQIGPGATVEVDVWSFQ